MRILHVEDRDEYREIVSRILKEHNVTSTASLQEAREVYEHNTFDVVICDGSINRNGDGIEWARELHLEGQRVIILSGDEGNYGPIPFINKVMFDGDQLRRMII